MAVTETLSKDVRAVLESNAALNLHHYPIDIDVRDGVLVLQGEVGDIIAKRMIPKLAATVPGVRDILDRLRVVPSERRGDRAILNAVYESLVQESAFQGYTLVPRAGESAAAVMTPRDDSRGTIEISVNDAVVSLQGSVQSLSHKRLADVLAWWVIGTVDVLNKLRIVPPEQDNDDEISDALRIVLEKDPWLDVGQILPHTKDRTVTLEGLVHSQEQRHMAECDAWYILGVHQVINHIEVRP